MDKTQYKPVVSYLEARGGTCTVRELTLQFKHTLLTALEQAGRIKTFKNQGTVWAAISSPEYTEVKPEPATRKPSNATSSKEGKKRGRPANPPVDPDLQEGKKRGRPAKPPVDPDLQEGKKRGRPKREHIKSDPPQNGVYPTPGRRGRKTVASKEKVYECVSTSLKPLMAADIQAMIPGSHIHVIRTQLNLLLDDGLIVGSRARDRYYTLPDKSSDLEGSESVRVSRLKKRASVDKILKAASAPMTVQEIQCAVTEAGDKVCTETVRNILEYFCWLGDVSCFRQHENAPFVYALNNNQQAIEKLWELQDSQLSAKIIKYLEKVGTKIQADISFEILGNRRPTNLLIDTLRKMVDNGTLAAQPCGAKIFYSIKES